MGPERFVSFIFFYSAFCSVLLGENLEKSYFSLHNERGFSNKIRHMVVEGHRNGLMNILAFPAVPGATRGTDR